MEDTSEHTHGNFKMCLEKYLEVVDVMSVVDSTHALHQYVHLTASFPRHIDSYGLVSLKNPHSHLHKKIGTVMFATIYYFSVLVWIQHQSTSTDKNLL